MIWRRPDAGGVLIGPVVKHRAAGLHGVFDLEMLP